jgi:hypothetical protein
MQLTPVKLNAVHGANQVGEVIGMTDEAARKLCSTTLKSGGTMARLATPEEVAASKGSKVGTVKVRKVQVRLLRPYGKNNPSDDPFFPEPEALQLIERGAAIRIPAAEARAAAESRAARAADAALGAEARAEAKSIAASKGALDAAKAAAEAAAEARDAEARDAEAAAEAEAEADTEVKKRQRRGPLASPKRTVPGGTVEKTK